MNKNIGLAVILAAGSGTRLHKHIKEMPKGFIKINNKTLIEGSIEALRENGIERIIIVTGYLNHFYDNLKIKYPFISTVKNKQYSNSGSMFSLSEASRLINEDFLLLESDLIYEKRAISEIIKTKDPNTILISGTTNSGDEVYVDGMSGKIINLSKDPKIIVNCVGEFVGISKISLNLYQQMNDLANVEFETSLKIEYECNTLAKVARLNPVPYLLLEDLIWTEIDNKAHLIRAKEMIYPKIIKKNKLENLKGSFCEKS